MNLKNLSKISANEIMAGSFGIEWESLRAKGDGHLSLTPHPSVFGDKLSNPYITTDFSESQIEIITSTYSTINEAFDNFSLISDIVNASLPDDEYLWFQSIPCILPYWDQIPIAQYSNEGKDFQKYREDLAKKYGVKKQMISGVHFNFSFDENFLNKLFLLESRNITFKEFKNEVYLKIARNYLRYCWLIIYLTGCSIGSHRTFVNDCLHLMDAQDKYGSYYSTKGPSFRNASCGYKNLVDLHPSYDSVGEFTRDISRFIENGDLSEAKELYAQIRLKPKNPKDILNSLNKDGIEYIEIRTLDINPFYKCGVVKQDMNFLHLFLIYMLIKEESDYAFWQKEAILNEENTAEKGYDESMKLLNDRCEITLREWALELIGEMFEMCGVLGIDEYNTLTVMSDRIVNPDLTYGKMLLNLIKEEGYINTHMNLSKNNKMISINNLKNMDIDNLGEIEKYVNIPLSCKY